MALQDKYKELIDMAGVIGINNLEVREQDNVLYIDGEAPSGSAKDQLWSAYEKIDPDFRSSDLVLNVNVSTMIAGAQAKVTSEKGRVQINR
jgi:HSP20 family molecular chaperone IbpA